MEPIDAVISWVDGKDPKFQMQLKNFCKAHNLNPEAVVAPTRINQENEIYYCLKLLNLNMPWLRKIYIITNQQIPPAINALEDQNFAQKIAVIDQNELLKLNNIHTPIFNSLSIEWLMWLIPNLANYFLYLNDDFFVIRPLKREDFFINGCIKIRGEWKTQTQQKFLTKMHALSSKFFKLKSNPHRTWQETAAKLAGFKKKFYFLDHAPYTLNKKTFAKYTQMHPNIIQENARKPFRCPEHISSIPLIVHLDIANNCAIDDKTKQAIMVNGGVHSLQKIKSRLKKALKNPKISFVCMQSIDEAPLEVKEYLLTWLSNFTNSATT